MLSHLTLKFPITAELYNSVGKHMDFQMNVSVSAFRVENVLRMQNVFDHVLALAYDTFVAQSSSAVIHIPRSFSARTVWISCPFGAR